MRFTLSERDPGIVVGMDRSAYARDGAVVEMFFHDSFPKERSRWGSKNLKIVKEQHGWALVHYNTPLVYRDSEGNFFWDDNNYSATTSKVQSYIRHMASDLDITMDIVSGREEMKEEMRREQLYDGGYSGVNILSIEDDGDPENARYLVTFEADNMDIPQSKVISKDTLESLTMEELATYIEDL